MSNDTLLLEDKDTAVTSFQSPAMLSSLLKLKYQIPKSADDMPTTAGIITGQNFSIVEPTSPWITIFVQKAPPQPLDVWLEADVYFPPKKTRPLIGKLIKRGRAKFETAFANELVEM